VTNPIVTLSSAWAAEARRPNPKTKVTHAKCLSIDINISSARIAFNFSTQSEKASGSRPVTHFPIILVAASATRRSVIA
jgi:hypothetical protein